MATEITPKLKLLTDSSAKIKTIIPREVSLKKNYLCSVIPSVEWSGMLFYTLEGDLDDPKSMVITLTDIHPMDKGSSAATTYKLDAATIVDLFDSKPHLMEQRLAHIHSHCTFGVFFSGTDTDELVENAPNHNGYLSLIVNNKGDIQGKIAFMGKSQEEVSRKISFNTIAGKLLEFLTPTKTEEDVVIAYDLEIVEEKPDSVTDSVFLAQVDEINKPKSYGKDSSNYPMKTSQKVGFQKTSGKKTLTMTDTWSENDIESFIMLLITDSIISEVPPTGLWGELHDWEKSTTKSIYPATKNNLEPLVQKYIDENYELIFSIVLGEEYRGYPYQNRMMNDLLKGVIKKLRIYSTMDAVQVMADYLEEIMKVELSLTPKYR